MDVEEIYAILDSNREHAEYRRKVAARCLMLLQDEVQENGGVYSGSMVPNFTSVAELLTCAYADVLEAVREFPALDPERAYPGRVN